MHPVSTLYSASFLAHFITRPPLMVAAFDHALEDEDPCGIGLSLSEFQIGAGRGKSDG